MTQQPQGGGVAKNNLTVVFSINSHFSYNSAQLKVGKNDNKRQSCCGPPELLDPLHSCDVTQLSSVKVRIESDA
jgi:hypothetical protein